MANRIVRLFKWKEDRDYGTNGWVLVGAPSAYNTGDARLVAHDCIEHFPGVQLGTVEDGLLALGACAWIRGDSRQGMNQRYTAGDNLSGDVGNLLCIRDVKGIGVVLPLEDSSTGYIDEALSLIDGMLEPTEDQVASARSWMYRGARMAAKRYSNDKDVAMYLYDAIVSEVKSGDYGDILKVSIGIKQCNVNVSIESVYE